MAMKVPSVRVLAICDEAILSEDEAEIYTLVNTRFYAVAESFPHVQTLHVHLLLYCDNTGTYQGAVRVTRSADDRMIRYSRFEAVFTDDSVLAALRVEIDWCVFSEPGAYLLEVRFMDEDGVEHNRGDSRILMMQGEDEDEG